ncbi:MAG: PaaI family thioesterase [Firmicutes bacterium]|nr:PaaI family thioesterase [Bacillota bacterium]
MTDFEKVCGTAVCTGCSQDQLDSIREKFSHDRFATEAAGITIEEVKPQYARCEMMIQPVHLNARGAVMGGAIFTLADFVGAVAANSCKDTTDVVTLHVSMDFLSAAKGNKLIGEACCLKDGRSTCLYEVKITDELGTRVAHATVNGFAVKK